MKFWLTLSAALLVLRSASAGGLPPESFDGALWGGIIGGFAGADCRHGFSGEGAAIGAGIGFAVGTLAGESRRAAERRYYSYSYAPPVSYGYVGASYVVQPVAVPAAAPAAAPRPAFNRIPDAPRVPDAPTF